MCSAETETNMNTYPALACCLFALAPIPAAEPIAFRTGPEVTKKGELLVISFALASPTDIEVTILNEHGAAIRHLAAGVLGGKSAPPEPLKAGLEQRIVWDGKDDFGKKPTGGPFKIRVRAGSSVKLGRFIGDDPYSFGRISSLAVDEDGRLHISAYE